MTDEACDIHLSDQKKLREWFTWLMDNVTADQLILERASKASNHYWIHVSCTGDPSKNRHQINFITNTNHTPSRHLIWKREGKYYLLLFIVVFDLYLQRMNAANTNKTTPTNELDRLIGPKSRDIFSSVMPS